MKVFLKQGARYQGEILLHGVETWVGDGTVQSKFADAGFTDITIHDVNAADRWGYGTWSQPDGEYELDPHIKPETVTCIP